MANATTSNLKSLDWLRDHLNDETVRIIDCRFLLGQPAAGREAYEAGHLPNAIHADLEQDLSGPITEHGGRHPLPDLQEFVQKLSRWGIDEKTTVVAYDDQGGAMASRLWWMLKYLGHEQAYLLNGTFSLWRQQGLPVTADIPTPPPTAFTPHLRPDMLASMEEVKSKLHAQDTALIDSREPVRYRGEQEPIDKKAGHIPGAVNRFWKDALQDDSTWKPADQQKDRFQAAGLDPQQEVIVYCGSGVTACPNVLALQEAGFEKVKLYLGSWSDWITNADNPVATAKDE